MERITELLSRLEALLRARTDRRDELLALVQMIRAALPSELAQAHTLREEAERLHRAAADEARRIVLEAQATARRLADHGAAYREAEQRRAELLARAEADARSIREGADAYAAQVLADLEDRVLRVLEAIRKGRQLLKGSGR